MCCAVKLNQYSNRVSGAIYVVDNKIHIPCFRVQNIKFEVFISSVHVYTCEGLLSTGDMNIVTTVSKRKTHIANLVITRGQCHAVILSHMKQRMQTWRPPCNFGSLSIHRNYRNITMACKKNSHAHSTGTDKANGGRARRINLYSLRFT